MAKRTGPVAGKVTEPIGFRRSHLLRVGAGSLAALDRELAPFREASRARITELKFDNIAGGRALLATLRSEHAGLLADIVAEDRAVEQGWGVSLLTDIRLDPSRTVGAWLDGAGAAPRVRISEGLCLALDDALLTSLCILGFFTRRPDKDEAPEGYAIGACGPDGAGRYFDYSATRGARAATLPRALTNMIPLDPVRFAQADLLLGFALHWVSLHEQAHWLLGHLDWLRAARGLGKAGIDEALFVDGDDPGRREENYCLELQADALATQLLFSHGLSDQLLRNRWVVRYRDALAAYGARRRSLAPDLSERQDRFHMLLLASALSCLLFERRRERLRAGSQSHPPPSTRLLNIFMGALGAWGDVEEYERGAAPAAADEYRLEHIRPAAVTASRAFVELEMAARVIGLESPLYRSDFLLRERRSAPVRTDLAPLADDFFQLMTGSRAADAFRTDGARTLVGLLDRSEGLYRALEPYAIVTGFR